MNPVLVGFAPFKTRIWEITMSWSARVGALLFLMGTLSPRPGQAASISDLEWLAGCWSSRGGEAGSEEHWLAPAGGSMLGVGHTVVGGKTVAHEVMQIRETEPGQLAFIARPSGQAEATFPLARLGKDEVVFENLAHDFPQRVIYRRQGDKLEARIEGTEDGKVKGIDFPMDRVACPASAGPKTQT
jgi:hypothetical protein